VAVSILYGTDASCSGPCPGLFNAFTVSVTQGITQATGFGESWMYSRGTVGSISGSMSGFVVSGSTNSPNTAIMAIGTATGRVGSSLTFTFGTGGDSIGFTGIQNGIGWNVEYLGNQTISVGFTGTGAPSVTWTQ
jgi:hypothetical protein